MHSEHVTRLLDGSGWQKSIRNLTTGGSGRASRVQANDGAKSPNCRNLRPVLRPQPPISTPGAEQRSRVGTGGGGHGRKWIPFLDTVSGSSGLVHPCSMTRGKARTSLLGERRVVCKAGRLITCRYGFCTTSSTPRWSLDGIRLSPDELA